MKQIVISDEMHQRIRVGSLVCGCTMSALVERILDKELLPYSMYKDVLQEWRTAELEKAHE